MNCFGDINDITDVCCTNDSSLVLGDMFNDQIYYITGLLTFHMYFLDDYRLFFTCLPDSSKSEYSFSTYWYI